VSNGIGSPPPPGRERNLWKILLGFGLASVVASLVNADLSDFSNRVNALYHAGARLAFDDNTDGSVLAKLFALFFAGTAAVLVVMTLLGDHLKRWSRAFRGKHTVIWGLDFLGAHLVQEFDRRSSVITVAASKDAESFPDVGFTGASLLVGDLATERLWKKAGASRASRLIAASADDAANIAVGLEAVRQAARANGRSAMPRVYVHVTNPQLRSSLRWKRAFRSAASGRPVTMFNVFDNCARLLLQKHGLDHERVFEHDSRSVQLIVIGFGQMGEAVLVRAALVAHYANQQPLRAIIIDRHATRKQDAFAVRYPELARVADLCFVEGEADSRSAQDVVARECGPHAITTVVVCLDHDTPALSLALSLDRELPAHIAIRVRLNDESLLPLVAAKAGSNSARRLTAFGSLRHACVAEEFDNPEADRMARSLHAAYVHLKEKEGLAVADDRSMRDWDELDDDLVESNRQLADHIPVKLRAIGCRLAHETDRDPGVLVPALTDEERLLLGKIEHRRWVAERRLAGWRHGDKNVEERLSPYLVPWDSLTRDVQYNDLHFAQILPTVLKLAGMEIRR
jgi:hypothetical protein